MEPKPPVPGFHGDSISPIRHLQEPFRQHPPIMPAALGLTEVNHRRVLSRFFRPIGLNHYASSDPPIGLFTDGAWAWDWVNSKPLVRPYPDLGLAGRVTKFSPI